jgi:hypothetical protein
MSVADRSNRSRFQVWLVVLLLVLGGILWGGQAIEDPSARSITIAVWWVASFSLQLVPGMRWTMGPIDIGARRTKWQRLTIYFAVGFFLFGIAVALLSTEIVVLWVVAGALLLVNSLWAVYGLRFLVYGRISGIESAGGGSALP